MLELYKNTDCVNLTNLFQLHDVWHITTILKGNDLEGILSLTSTHLKYIILSFEKFQKV